MDKVKKRKIIVDCKDVWRRFIDVREWFGEYVSLAPCLSTPGMVGGCVCSDVVCWLRRK